MHRDFRNQKGFSLIELSIVLIIIGIIIGAIMKGQDLITNARSKKFTTEIRTWEIGINTYFDRYGHFPGDNTTGGATYDGIIGNSTGDSVYGDVANANFTNPPPNSLTLGGNTYYVYVGNDGATTPKNVIIVCLNAACTGPLDTNSAAYFSALSAAITGNSDATGVVTKNVVYGITAAPTAQGVLATTGTIKGSTVLSTITTPTVNWGDPANLSGGANPVMAMVYTLQ